MKRNEVAVGFLQQLIDFVKKEEYGEISTIVGRYYAMDRDKRWERIRVELFAYKFLYFISSCISCQTL